MACVPGRQMTCRPRPSSGCSLQRAQNLRFLAPHHIRRAGLARAGKARKDGDSAPIDFKAQRRGGDGGRLGRAFQIRHFPPADGRAHHAAEQRRQLPMRIVPGRHRSGKTAGAIGHRGALAFGARQHMAVLVAQIKPQPAGAPVARDECRPAHGRFLQRGSGLVEQRAQLGLACWPSYFWPWVGECGLLSSLGCTAIPAGSRPRARRLSRWVSTSS